MNWKTISGQMANEQEYIRDQRGMRYGASPGIAILTDPLALRWQRLETMRKRIATHLQTMEIKHGLHLFNKYFIKTYIRK